MVIAAIAMYDSRRGALIGATNDPGGIGSGFYPFWASAFMGLAALVLMARAATSPRLSAAAFTDRQGAMAVLKLAVPMVVYGASILWLGLYLATGVYMAFFARSIGHYRWLRVVAVAVLVPLALYLVFEQGFRMVLPKSILYGDVVPI